MRLLPQASEWLPDEDAAVRMLVGALRRASVDAAEQDPAVGYPGLWALAYRLQGAGPLEPGGVEGILEAARRSAERARCSGCAALPIDLATPEPHLNESLARAVAQAPRRPGREAGLAEMGLGGWSPAERSIFCAAGCLLRDAWPELAGEVGSVVRQVALMDGGGIDGFTDFRVHGAVFVNRRRFATGRPIPAEIRVAEALVHEGTHTRCNAAALGRPFLLPAGTDDDLLVLTPLRPDLRPLNGLFQQVVVLARCLSLYDRLAGAGNGGEAVAARRDKLLAQSRQGLGTIGAHRARLAPHGLEVLGEAEAVMARIPAAAG